MKMQSKRTNMAAVDRICRGSALTKREQVINDIRKARQQRMKAVDSGSLGLAEDANQKIVGAALSLVKERMKQGCTNWAEYGDLAYIAERLLEAAGMDELTDPVRR